MSIHGLENKHPEGAVKYTEPHVSSLRLCTLPRDSGHSSERTLGAPVPPSQSTSSRRPHLRPHPPFWHWVNTSPPRAQSVSKRPLCVSGPTRAPARGRPARRCAQGEASSQHAVTRPHGTRGTPESSAGSTSAAQRRPAPVSTCRPGGGAPGTMTDARAQGPGSRGPELGGSGDASSPGARSGAAVLPELSPRASARSGPRCPPPRGRLGAAGRPCARVAAHADAVRLGAPPARPRHVPTLAPARSPSLAGTAALTSSRKPAVSRARTRFKPARPRWRRAPPGGASSRAALARAESAWAGSAEGRAPRPAPRLGRVVSPGPAPWPGHAPEPGRASPGHAPSRATPHGPATPLPRPRRSGSFSVKSNLFYQWFK